jgi:competence protein ComEC
MAFLAIGFYLFAHFSSGFPIFYVPYIKSTSALVFMACIAFGITYNFDEQNHADYFKNQKGKYLYVRINSLPQQKVKSIMVDASVLGIGDSIFKKSRGNLRLYLQKEEKINLHYGDELLLLRKAIKPVPPIQNPFEFDFQLFLHRNNIHHQAYLNKKQWTNTNKNSGHSFFKLSFNLQQYLQSVYTQYLTNKQHRGIIEAIVFGYKNDLDKEVISAYSKTGIIHVLAVSGLHVGLIFSVLSLFTSWLTSSLFKKRIRVVIIILFLMAYAVLTGLSPSVCRAVLMFSFFVFKDAVKRETNVYNVLAASAIILLTIQPLWLFNVGFQLSYLAVFSIVFLQKHIKNWFVFTDWFLAKAWTLMAVSIAAQIITFPLCLYYFHQYPNLFFISNLIVIPLIFIVLSLAACLPLFAYFKIMVPITHLTAQLIDFYLEFINTFVFKIQNLPYAYFDNLYINTIEMWLIFALVFSMLLWLIYKLPKLIWPSLLFAMLLIFSQANRILQNQGLQSWVSFNIKGHSNLGYKNGTDLILFLDSFLYTNRALIDFHCKPWFLAKCGGNLIFESMDSLTVSPTNRISINGDSIYILPQNKSKIIAEIPLKSKVFCLQTVYEEPTFSNLTFIAPSIKSTRHSKNGHSLHRNGFWLKSVSSH